MIEGVCNEEQINRNVNRKGEIYRQRRCSMFLKIEFFSNSEERVYVYGVRVT